MKEKQEMLGGMTLVKRRLQAVLASREASPAQRLLNDMIGLMSFSDGVDMADQADVHLCPPACHFSARRPVTRFAYVNRIRNTLPKISVLALSLSVSRKWRGI